MNMDKKFLKNVMTSGEAAMHAINQNKYGKSFFHLGPPRDISVFEKVKGDKTGIENCDFILCTGLFDEYENDLNYYETLLKNHVNKKLICTNPDLTVHRGNIEELCAGTIAKIFSPGLKFDSGISIPIFQASLLLFFPATLISPPISTIKF